MKRILLFVIMQIVCIVTEIAAGMIPVFALQIWILLIVASIVISCLAYRNGRPHSRFIIKILTTEVVSLTVWLLFALLLINAYALALSPESIIFENVVFFVFAPILSLWSTGWWAFLKLWPFSVKSS